MTRLSTPALLAILVAATLAFAANGALSAGMIHVPLLLAQTAPSATTSPGGDTTSAVRPNEAAFLQDATVAGRSAVELARLGVSQANSAAVRDLAQQMVTDYAQIDESLAALARRKSVALPPTPTGFSSDYRQLSSQTGDRFDRAYIHIIAATSEHELRLFESAIANAKDADVRDLAGSTLPVLRDHMNKLTDLEKAL